MRAVVEQEKQFSLPPMMWRQELQPNVKAVRNTTLMSMMMLPHADAEGIVIDERAAGVVPEEAEHDPGEVEEEAVQVVEHQRELRLARVLAPRGAVNRA